MQGLIHEDLLRGHQSDAGSPTVILPAVQCLCLSEQPAGAVKARFHTGVGEG